MGLFGGNYMKEGPGVDKNAPKKKGFFLFWDIIIRKFTKMFGVNILHFAMSIVYLAFVYTVLSGFVMVGFGLDKAMDTTAQLAGDEQTIAQVQQLLDFTVRSLITIFIFNFFGSGLLSAPYAYIMRCYTRGEHVWIWSDGWDKFKENLKYTVPIFIIDSVIIALGMNAISFYGMFEQQSSGMGETLFTFIRYFTIVILFLYMMMHIYIYQIMVTYDCKFGELFKSAAVMTLAKLPMNLLLTVITGGVIIALFYFVPNPMVSTILYIVAGGVLLRYPLEFYASRVIEKNIKAVKKNSTKNEAKITYID